MEEAVKTGLDPGPGLQWGLGADEGPGGVEEDEAVAMAGGDPLEGGAGVEKDVLAGGWIEVPPVRRLPVVDLGTEDQQIGTKVEKLFEVAGGVGEVLEDLEGGDDAWGKVAGFWMRLSQA